MNLKLKIKKKKKFKVIFNSQLVLHEITSKNKNSKERINIKTVKKGTTSKR